MRKDLYWPIGITTVIVLFLGFLIGAFIFSRNLPLNLVSKNYYQQGIEYEKQIERMRHTQMLPRKPQWKYDAARQQLILSLPNVEHFQDWEGKVTFFRPSDATQDFTLPLQPDSSGQQIFSVEHLSRGLWRVHLFWKADTVEFFHETVLNIR